MSKPKTPVDTAPNADIEAAIHAAEAELRRRSAYLRLKNLEWFLGTFPPVPDDPPYVETSPGFDPDLAKS